MTLERVRLDRRRIRLLELGMVAGVRAMAASKVHTVAPDSIIVRQRAFDAWVPPEQSAPEGGLTLYEVARVQRESPCGLCCQGKSGSF